MKRYLVFGGANYYPDGGWHDLRSAHDLLEDAMADFKKRSERHDWCHVVDAQAGEIIASHED